MRNDTKIIAVRDFRDFLYLANKGWEWIEANHDDTPKQVPEGGFLLHLRSFDDWQKCVMVGYEDVKAAAVEIV